MVITIDGPAGSGKSTAARNLARALGIAYLDTGATYRAVTLKALREGVDMTNEAALVEAARRADIRLEPRDAGVRVLLDGDDVSDAIRTAEVTKQSYYPSRYPGTRAVLAELQRRVGEQLGDFVTEGRDQGTAVFPDAGVKFYLDARPEVRARRRAKEMRDRGEDADEAEVLAAILERDENDRSRAVGPLRKPDDAVEVDTSDRTPEETLVELLRRVEAAG